MAKDKKENLKNTSKKRNESKLPQKRLSVNFSNPIEYVDLGKKFLNDAKDAKKGGGKACYLTLSHRTSRSQLAKAKIVLSTKLNDFKPSETKAVSYMAKHLQNVSLNIRGDTGNSNQRKSKPIHLRHVYLGNFASIAKGSRTSWKTVQNTVHKLEEKGFTIKANNQLQNISQYVQFNPVFFYPTDMMIIRFKITDKKGSKKKRKSDKKYKNGSLFGKSSNHK